jgi:hypothetical protein
MKVPAWPIPIHQTKSVMANAHATGMLFPHVPIPFAIVQLAEKMKRSERSPEMAKRIHHTRECVQMGESR